jgi:rubredoxin
VLGTLFNVALALVAAYLIFKVGFAMLGGLARPLPEPPPPGEMRKVKLRYRCSLCGLELRIDRAIDEDPIAPRHCMEDMDLEVPVD